MSRLSNLEPRTKNRSGDETGPDAGFAPPSLGGLKVPAEHIATMMHVVWFPRTQEDTTGRERPAGLDWDGLRSASSLGTIR